VPALVARHWAELDGALDAFHFSSVKESERDCALSGRPPV